jgi:hypothetical protein
MMGLADPGVKQPEGPRRRPPKLGRAPRSGHGGEWYARLWTLSNEPEIGQTLDRRGPIQIGLDSTRRTNAAPESQHSNASSAVPDTASGPVSTA